ncbi:MAG: hypothetical protein AAFZ11_14965 [Pseudomonadota bacterium]
MVPTLVSIILFASFGAWRAKRAQGRPVDVLHYAAAHGIFGLIIGVILAIVLSRLI